MVGIKITAEPGKNGKTNVFADGEFEFSIESSIWYELGVLNESEISEEEFSKIKLSSEKRKAYDKALRLLTNRACSEKELYNKLILKFSPEASDYAINKCKELGFLDDREFSEKYARQLMKNKKYAPKRIKQELYNKGVKREIVEDALNNLDFDAKNSIKEIIDKKYADSVHDEKGLKRTAAALVRMGYGFSDIKSSLKEYLNGEENYEY